VRRACASCYTVGHLPSPLEWFFAQVGALRVLPLVSLEASPPGRDVARALAVAGLTVMEVSLDSADALEAIREIAQTVPEMLLGAGAVLRPEQVDEALAAGARFVGSPTVDRAVIRRAQQREVPVIPGVAKHADVIAAAREGVRVARLAVGPTGDGPRALRGYARLFPSMQFIPAGPIAVADVPDYAREPGVLAVASTRLTPPGASPAEVERLAFRAASAALRAVGLGSREA